jgi:hypothetical protein
MNTGENEHGLRKILDMTRFASMLVLGLHYYYTFFNVFSVWKWRSALTDRILVNIAHTGLFNEPLVTKGVALSLLTIALLGVRGRKQEKLGYRTAVIYLAVGSALYFGSGVFFCW